MKVLLVDDEIFTIRMLQSVIPWNELGLELAGYAQNGEDAYVKVAEERPDIIISDVRMPGMDGLELLRRVYAFDSGIKTILMSAYADFSYIKEGLKLGCSDYILKPVDETELEHSLRKVVYTIQGEKAQEQAAAKSEKQLDNMNLYRYMKTGYGKNKILKLEQEAGLKEYCVFMIQINNTTMDEYSSSANIELGQEGYYCRILEKIASECCERAYVFDYDENCWIMILGGLRGMRREDAAVKIVEDSKREMGFSVSVCFSVAGHSLEELPFLYNEVQSLSRYSFYIGDEEVLGYDYNCSRQELNEVRSIGMLRDIGQAVRERNTEAAEKIINEAFAFSKDIKDAYGFSAQVAEVLEKNIPAENLSKSRREELQEAAAGGLAEISSVKELKGQVLALLAYIPAEEGQDRTGYSRSVKESIEMIENNYDQNLSLEDICARVLVSKTYFCYLFKRETGMSVWNYLTVVRLRHAKELLEKTQLRSYEVAFQVGYENPSYFSKIFKKYENMTPNEYRESRK